MIDLSRRSFLRGLFTVAAVSIIPAIPGPTGIPRIIGDGVYDDATGLQAALDGKSFECEGHVIRIPNALSIRGGTYRLGSTLHVRDVPVVVTDATFTGDPCGSSLWYFHERPAGAPTSYMSNCHFDCSGGGSSAIGYGAGA